MGRIYHPWYTVKKPNGKKVRKVVETWHIEFTDVRGRTVRRKAGTKAQATDAPRLAEAAVLNEKNGLPTRRVADILCTGLMKEYLADQQRDVCPGHCRELKRRLEAVLAGTRSLYLVDLTPEAVDRFLDGLIDNHRSARTVNTYLQAVRGMLNWRWKNGRSRTTRWRRSRTDPGTPCANAVRSPGRKPNGCCGRPGAAAAALLWQRLTARPAA